MKKRTGSLVMVFVVLLVALFAVPAGPVKAASVSTVVATAEQSAKQLAKVTTLSSGAKPTVKQTKLYNDTNSKYLKALAEVKKLKASSTKTTYSKKLEQVKGTLARAAAFNAAIAQGEAVKAVQLKLQMALTKGTLETMSGLHLQLSAETKKLTTALSKVADVKTRNALADTWKKPADATLAKVTALQNSVISLKGAFKSLENGDTVQAQSVYESVQSSLGSVPAGTIKVALTKMLGDLKVQLDELPYVIEIS